MSVVSRELDYKPVVISHGSYQLSKVTSQLQLAKLTNTSGLESIFELPPKVMNFSKSILSFTATAPTSGGNPVFNWLHTDGCPWIREIHVYDRQGLFLAQVPAFNYYMKSVARKSSKIMTINAENAPKILTNRGILNAGRKSELDQLSMAEARFKNAYVVIKNMDTMRAITSN